MDWRFKQRNPVFPGRLGFLVAIGALLLPVACVSGTIGGGSNQQGNGAQAGSSGQLPGGEPGAGADGQQQPGAAGSGTSVPAPTALPTENACSTPGSPGPRVMRRLTAGEFAASI